MVNSTLEVLFWPLLGLLMLCTTTAHWYHLLLILIILGTLLGAVPGNKVGLVTTDMCGTGDRSWILSLHGLSSAHPLALLNLVAVTPGL